MLETVYLDLQTPPNNVLDEPHRWKYRNFYNIMTTFKLLSNATSLTWTPNTITALSKFPLLLKKQDSPFRKLKSLKLTIGHLKSTPPEPEVIKFMQRKSTPPEVIKFMQRGIANDEILDFEYA
ncbi:hypothetical protein ACFE04_022841 [Oxalis oulophora]